MKTKKTIQDANLKKQKVSNCCCQAEAYAPENAPQPEAVKNPPDQEHELPPYFHREIF
ncbi:MAG: hypothetical protein PVI99_00055 [Anaerolineales bacterium]|jgi:hypothetical protein